MLFEDDVQLSALLKPVLYLLYIYYHTLKYVI
jgi:hypothetical protein